MVQITIHRGTHQIGGCATEIEYDGERVLIDLGANLPGSEKEAALSDEQLLDSVFGVDRKRKFDAILFSHYHGDHYGLYKEIPKENPLYIGSCAKQILHIIAGYVDRNTDKKGSDIIKGMHLYQKGKCIPELKKLKITPFSVDHSALDAYMFLIEAGEKKILFTGDFRDHGIANERNQLWRTLDQYVGKHINILITEGTMLSRIGEAKFNTVQTEEELGKQAAEYFLDKKYNFVMVSSTNLDSIMEFYHNTPEDKLFLCDQYQARLIMTAMENKGIEFWQYRAKEEAPGFYKKIGIIGAVHPFIYRDLQKRGEILKEKGMPHVYWKHVTEKDFEKSGFVMLVRPNRFWSANGQSLFESLFQHYRKKDEKQVNLIYSMWEGYLRGDKEDKDITRFIDGFDMKQLHTSGHAYVETIQRLLEKTNPDLVIPMHTELADEFCEMTEFAEYKSKIKVLQDGETLEIGDFT